MVLRSKVSIDVVFLVPKKERIAKEVADLVVSAAKTDGSFVTHLATPLEREAWLFDF